MLPTTDMLVRQHMAYLNTLENPAEELNRFDTVFDHMLYYFMHILDMPHAEAVAVVANFKMDSDNAPYEDCDFEEIE